jgi:hypothetical protein
MRTGGGVTPSKGDAPDSAGRPQAIPNHEPPRWLNLPCTDPLGPVVAFEDRVFRAVYPHKTAVARTLLEAPSVADLMADGLVAKAWISDRQLSGAGLVLEVERASFDVPCDRFIGSCLQAAFERWVEMALRLDGTGFCLSDAHFGNFMLFGRNEPRWIDLGSIRPIQEVTPDVPFRGFEELWKGMLTPLLVLRQAPHRARLARLAIGDYPYQGPRTVANEPPLPLSELVAGEREELRRMLGAATGRDAILATFEFACAKLGEGFSHPAAPAAASADSGALRRLLTDAGARRITCLGADVFGAFANGFDDLDAVVVDEDATRLEQLAAALKARPGRAGTVALYLEHAVNRIFLRRASRTDAVLALDPFRRFAHNSDVMLENVAAILAALGTLAVITVPRELSVQLAGLLRGFFADVVEAPAPTSDQTLVCRHPHV